MSFLIKVSYLHDGFSVWRQEKDPIPLYASLEETYKQACAIFFKEAEQSVDCSQLQTIKNLVNEGNYSQAYQQIKSSKSIKFLIFSTQNAQAEQPMFSGSQLPLNINMQEKITLTKSSVNHSAKFCTGTGNDSCLDGAPSIKQEGATCYKCNKYNEFANFNGNAYLCYACR